jgi:GNAT superfamily N-acetyltransferase
MQFDAPTADELDLVFDAWINSFKKSPWAGCVPNQLWFETQRETIRGILNRGASVVVAVTPIQGREAEWPDVRRVMGYAVTEKNVLHWLYVKDDYRGYGIGRALLNEVTRLWPDGPAPWVYTHRTKASVKFLGERPRPWRWDPVPARVKELR